MKLEDFEPSIFGKLSEIQNQHPDLIDPRLDIYDDFGLERSFRRGATKTRAQNARVSTKEHIDWIARWGNAAKEGKSPYFEGNMMVSYSDTKIMAPTFVRFSRAL